MQVYPRALPARGTLCERAESAAGRDGTARRDFRSALTSAHACTVSSRRAERIRAQVLLGVHGSGLMNAVFMAKGSLLIEVFPSSFAGPGSFGLPKYTFLRRLG